MAEVTEKTAEVTEKKEFSTVSAIRTFFGMKAGEDLHGFMAELKSLTTEDKAWLGEECAKALGGVIKKA